MRLLRLQLLLRRSDLMEGRGALGNHIKKLRRLSDKARETFWHILTLTQSRVQLFCDGETNQTDAIVERPGDSNEQTVSVSL